MKDLVAVFLIAVSLSLLAGFGGASLHASETHAIEQVRSSYIVQGESIDDAIWAVQAVGGEITQELRIINAVAALMTNEQRNELEDAQGVVNISRNGKAGVPSPVTGD